MKLTPSDIVLFAWGIHKLAKEGPVIPSVGICYNLSIVCGDARAYDLVQAACVSWDGFSGDALYPITGGDFHSGGRWEGGHLEQRMSLLAHMAKYLEDLRAEPGDSRPDNA